MAGPLNGAGNEVREQTDEQPIFEKGSGSLDAPFVDVHDVSDFLKRIKRNPRRKNDAKQRQWNVVKAEVVQHPDEGAGKKIKILENSENGEVQDEREDEPLPAMWILLRRNDFLSDQKIHRGAANHEREKPPVPPAVKEVTRQQKKDILGTAVQPPKKKNDRDQEQEESGGIKKHGS